METTKLIDTVIRNLDTRELRENIIVKRSNHYEHGTNIIAQFQRKEHMFNGYFTNSTNFNMTEGYFAEFILRGLRFQKDYNIQK